MADGSARLGALGSRGLALLACAAALAAGACDGAGTATDPGPGLSPAPPRAFTAYYYDGAVHLEWELDEGWDGEPFRVYSRRAGQDGYQRIAEVTSCADGLCYYGDRNVARSTTYVYFVAAVDPQTGEETDSEEALEVTVPEFDPPPAPATVTGVGLDGAAYLHWTDEAVQGGDFYFYRVYAELPEGDAVFLGETDSEGFIDELAANGHTYGYWVTAVSRDGHEGEESPVAEVTPRPDYHGEVLVAHGDDPDRSGFQFPEDEQDPPVVPGDRVDRHFRVEAEGDGIQLVPADGVEVHPEGFFTSALRCGPSADFDCQDLATAPGSGYGEEAVLLEPSHTYAVRYVGEGGGWRYAAVRATHVGESQDGRILVFDWAHQLQEGNRALSPPGGESSLREGDALRSDG